MFKKGETNSASVNISSVKVEFSEVPQRFGTPWHFLEWQTPSDNKFVKSHSPSFRGVDIDEFSGKTTIPDERWRELEYIDQVRTTVCL